VRIAAILLPVAFTASAWADEALLWQAVAKGRDVVVLMRHAEPSGGDPLAWDESGRCAGESMLTSAGKAHAKRIGEAFASRAIDVAVISSPMCRCRDTAQIAFGSAPVTDGNLREVATADANRMIDFERKAQAMIAAARGGKPVVFVSHRPNIDRLTMELIESGDLLVGRVGTTGEISVLGKLRIP
jgi:phosphohistidine phosphatase SixA